MRYSQLFGKSRKQTPKEDLSINAKLLTQGGFIDQLMSGSYTLLPLGLKVVKKIEQIIREEINATGGQEVLMPLLHPKAIWNETGRWEKAKAIMYQLKKDEKEYALSFTHEEIALDLARKHSQTYKDYPIKFYHFSTKFRDELRAKSGILRGREFIMKDLYSLHTTKEDFEKYYEEMKKVYLKIFKRFGLDAIVTESGGGVFTKNVTHEFQVLCDAGEDDIVLDSGGKTAKNIELFEDKSKQKTLKAIEVGNIFGFGQEYSKKMNLTFTNEKGEKEYPYLGSYGIGLTRAMGAVVEVHHDDRGIVWPSSVAPFQVHLVHIEDSGTESTVEKVYKELTSEGIDVLWDDREDVSAGQKFTDADLIGIPVRLVVSKKTHSASRSTVSSDRIGSGQAGDKVEFKKRNEEKTQLMPVQTILKTLSQIKV